MDAHYRTSIGRRCERFARRTFCGTPATLVIATALGGAWALQSWLQRQTTASVQPSCLHVVAPAQSGQLTWIVGATPGVVRSGDVLARLGEPPSVAELRSPANGAVRAVLKAAGDTVQAGDPILIVGPELGSACP
jgi:multidrug resistance efflux pump